MDISDGETLNVAIAADHAGFVAKKILKQFILDSGIKVRDFGTNSESTVDYPVFAVKVAESVALKESDIGILLCSTGIGMSITANKISGIRAALCKNSENAKLARQHNNANVLILSSSDGNHEDRKAIFQSFITAEFNGGRHNNRVNLIHKLTGR